MNRSYFLLFLISLFLTSCDPDALLGDLSEEVNASSTLNIRLTDGPIDLDEVNIDLQQVFIKGPDGFEEIPLGTNAGVYDLLDFQNGKDVLIASIEELQLTQIREIRLVLGENNTVVVDDVSYELKIPSGSQSGLKIKVCLDLTDMPEYDLILDFDAGASVHKTGNGKYIMKPVIKVVNPDAKCGKDDDDDDDDDDFAPDDLPNDAIEWLKENYDGYKFKVEKDTLCDGVEVLEVYIVEARKNDEKVYLYFNLEGTFLQSAEKIGNEVLPDIVITKIGEDYPDYSIMDNNKTFQIVRANEDVWYHVRLQNSSGQLNVTYQENGTFVCGQTVSDDDGEDDDEGEDDDDGEEEDEITLDDLPEEVANQLSETYSGYNFTIEAQTFCDGTEIYLLEGKNGSNTILVYFDLDWNLLQSAEWFDEDKLPTDLLKAIPEKYSGYKIMNNQTWEITRANGDLWYRIYLKKNNSSEKFYVIYTADGTFICQEN